MRVRVPCTQVSPASDVYAFGVLLWEMTARVVPWQGLSPVQVAARVVVGGETLPVQAMTKRFVLLESCASGQRLQLDLWQLAADCWQVRAACLLRHPCSAHALVLAGCHCPYAAQR